MTYALAFYQVKTNTCVMLFYELYFGCYELFTTKETAEKLGISTGRIRQMVLAGQLHAEKFGRELMISEADIKAVRIAKQADRKRRKTTTAKQMVMKSLSKRFLMLRLN